MWVGWMFGHLERALQLVSLWMALTALAACGGGGGGSGDGGGGGNAGGGTGGTGGNPPPALTGPPLIEASVANFRAQSIPAPLLANGGNTLVVVGVRDPVSQAAVETAAVLANNVPLAYVPDLQAYRGWLLATSGDAISVSVAVNGQTYQASSPLIGLHPQILSPPPRNAFPTNGLPTAEVLTTLDTLVTWAGNLPGPEYRYAVTVLDERGELYWPSRTRFHFVGGSATRQVEIGAGGIPSFHPYISTGTSRTIDIAGAAAGSSLSIGAFSMSSVFAVSSRVSVPISMELKPRPVTLTRARTVQLSARAIREDGSGVRSLEDVTGRATWASDNPAIVSVGANGLVTGSAAGQATVSATLGTLTATVVVRVAEPGATLPAGVATAYQGGPAHDGAAAAGPVSLPSAQAWSVTLPGPVSYPVIAGGRVFVLVGEGGEAVGNQSAQLYAHDTSDGTRLWGPVEVSRPAQWAGHAFDRDTVVVVNRDCLVRGFDASTGSLLWSTQIDVDGRTWICQSPPTTFRGNVYVVAAGVGSTVVALDVLSGQSLWTAEVNGSGVVTPNVSDVGLFVGLYRQAYRLDPYTGELQWHFSGNGSGGGARIAVLHDGRLYTRDAFSSQVVVFDAQTGIPAGTFDSTAVPAASNGRLYLVNQGQLSSIDAQTQATVWTTSGQLGLVQAPIVVGDVVFVASSTGMIQAFSASTGQWLWQASAGSAVNGIDESNTSAPLVGLNVGDGHLIVPAGDRLTAFRVSP